MNQLIRGDDAIRGAISRLHPVSKDACRTLVGSLPDIRNIHMNEKLMAEEMIKCMLVTGISHGLSKEQIRTLIEQDGPSVIIIAGSIHELHFQKSSGGWGKKAAVLGAGILIGALFG